MQYTYVDVKHCGCKEYSNTNNAVPRGSTPPNDYSSCRHVSATPAELKEGLNDCLADVCCY